MSLYNSLFGCHPLAMFVLRTLGLHVSSVPRFRDVYLQAGKIVVYTRSGGGNRDYYESEESCRECYPSLFNVPGQEPEGPWNSDLRRHPLYISDSDCEIDSTYANFYFCYPIDYRSELEMLEHEKPTISPADCWRKVLE
jgi:hypothetical protein